VFTSLAFIQRISLWFKCFTTPDAASLLQHLTTTTATASPADIFISSITAPSYNASLASLRKKSSVIVSVIVAQLSINLELFYNWSQNVRDLLQFYINEKQNTTTLSAPSLIFPVRSTTRILCSLSLKDIQKVFKTRLFGK
jgi:hypothetical protein